MIAQQEHQDEAPMRSPEFSIRSFIFKGLAVSVIWFAAISVMVSISYSIWGAPFLDLLKTREFSAALMITFGVGMASACFASMLSERSERASSIWMPVRIAILSAWFVPSIPFEGGEPISALAYISIEILRFLF